MRLELAMAPASGRFDALVSSMSIQRDTGEEGLAHDLRNILNIISGNLSLLARSVGDDPIARRHIDRAMAGVDLGTRLTRSVGGVMQRRSTRIGVDLHALRDSIESVVADAVGASVTAAVEIPPSVARIAVDRTALENAIVNLAVNAGHAMSGVGSLTITFGEVCAGGRTMVVMTVSDTGCGMPKHVADRIFDPYFTTKGDAGSGLGLAMVKRFADECGGSVEVESVVGRGTNIRISMPAAI